MREFEVTGPLDMDLREFIADGLCDEDGRVAVVTAVELAELLAGVPANTVLIVRAGEYRGGGLG